MSRVYTHVWIRPTAMSYPPVYEEAEMDIFLNHIESIYLTRSLEKLTDNREDIKNLLFKAPRDTSGLSRHTVTQKTTITLDSNTVFTSTLFPKLIKGTCGLKGVLIGHYEYGWDLYLTSSDAIARVDIDVTRSTYSRNTKRYTDTKEAITHFLNEIDSSKVSVKNVVKPI